jgi:hypothetical protein
MIDGEVTRSDSLSRVSIEAGHTFFLLMTRADDYGRFDGRLKILLADLYPLREEVSLELLSVWLGELVREGLLHRYECKSRPYLHFPTWGQYQRLRNERESKWPEPAGCCEEAEEGGTRRQLAAVGGLNREARSEKREARIEEPGSAEPAPSASPSTSRRKTAAPQELPVEDVERVRAWIEDVMPKRVDEAERFAEACLDHHRSKGNLHADWTATVITWIRKSENWRREKTGEPPLRSRAESIRLRSEVERRRSQMEARALRWQATRQ